MCWGIEKCGDRSGGYGGRSGRVCGEVPWGLGGGKGKCGEVLESVWLGVGECMGWV